MKKHDDNEVVKFLKDSSTQLLIIIGASKSGKTTICKEAFETVECDVFQPDYGDYKLFEESVDNFIHSKGILIMFTTDKQKVIYLDDAEDLFGQFRMAKTYCMEILEKNSSVKMIITLPPAEEKKVNDIRKISKTILRLIPPSILYNENDYADKSLYEIVLRMFESYNKDINDLECGLSSDALLISYMMYDNISNVLPDDVMLPIRKVFCELSEIEDYAFKNNEWEIVDWYTLVEGGIIRYQQKGCIDKLSPFSLDDITFTQIPCRSSQRFCTMRKKTQVEFLFGISNMTMQIMGDLTTKKTKNKTENQDVDHIINAYTSNLTITKPRTRKVKNEVELVDDVIPKTKKKSTK